MNHSSGTTGFAHGKQINFLYVYQADMNPGTPPEVLQI